jgi:hypothetical protein
MSIAIEMASLKDSKTAPKPGCWKRMTAPITNVMSSGASLSLEFVISAANNQSFEKA